jgi:hypothetical protein
MPSLFVIVPGFGNPHIQEKIRILESNLQRIRTFPWTQVCIRVCVYDNHAMPNIPTHLRQDPDIEWICTSGIVGQFIHQYAPPNVVATFDYCMILLDDIELQSNVDFAHLMDVHQLFQLDMYAPSMTLDSKYQFEYMLTQPTQPYLMKVVPACEAFCYFIPSQHYARYYQHIDPQQNPWLWGMDMCMYKCLEIRVGILNTMTMKHYYKNECYHLRPDASPCEGYEFVLRKHGVTSEELAEQPAVMYYIVENARPSTIKARAQGVS